MGREYTQGVKKMGVPTAIIVMIALIMFIFAMAAIIIIKKKKVSLKQTIDEHPVQKTYTKDDRQ